MQTLLLRAFEMMFTGRQAMTARVGRVGRMVKAPIVGAVMVGMAACGGDGPTGQAPVASVSVTAPSGAIVAGQTYQLTLTALDAGGKQLSGRTVSWTSSNSAVATVSTSGLLSALSGGTVTISATAEGKSGSMQLTVAPKPVASVHVSATSSTVYVQDQLQLTRELRGADGEVLGVRPTIWTSSSNSVAVVSTSGLVTGISVGQATITARSEGTSGTFTVDVQPMPAPVVTGATQMVSGQSGTITGQFFLPDVFGNTVTIGGEPATVTAATRTQLTVTVPCLPTGSTTVQVTRSGSESAPINTTVTTVPTSIVVGASVILGAPNASCVELPAAGGNARYLVTVANVGTSLNSTSGVHLSGVVAGAAAARRVIMPQSVQGAFDMSEASHRQQEFDKKHFEQLELNRREYERLRALTQGADESRSSSARSPAPEPGESRSFIIQAGISGCNNVGPTIEAKAVHVGDKAVLWEDQSNALLSTNDADLASYYRRLVQIYDLDQHESVKANFGDPLLRDVATDNDGKLHMVFTQRLNNTGTAAYVTACDQYPKSVAPASNYNQIFYGNVPTVSGSNVNNTNFPNGWFYFMARTVVHEVKHIASHSARVANGAPQFEISWLEEGSARMAEEMWVRESLHHVNWKANTGWGSANTNGIYCDFHPLDETCNAADPLRRPSFGLRRQFHEIRPKLLQPWEFSPYGEATGQSGSIFYNTVWSLLRYTIDRYAVSDAAFLTAMNSAITQGTATISAVAGVPMEQLIVGWGMALFADDYPGLPTTNLDVQFQTWNLRSIYAGLNASTNWMGSYPNPFPIVPAQASFGSFQADVMTIRSGAHAYVELSGNSTVPQTLRLRSASGGAISSDIRMAILRLQ